MKELIRVNYENDRPTVSARELHDFLEVKTQFKDWFPRMCEYGFTEGEDFSSFLSESTGGRPSHDAQLTIDMAKEICMLQRNEKGKLARKYFIQLEKDWNSPEKVMARALDIAHRTIKSLQAENKELERTKAWINDKKTATAMNTASQKSKEVRRLKIELDRSKEYASIKAIEKSTRGKFKWQPLRNYCTSHELEMKKVFDPNFGAVNTYPAEAWQEVYGIDLTMLFD